MTYGLRAVHETSGYHFFVELAGTTHVKAGPDVSRSNVQWSEGVELQVAEGYWLSTGFERRYAQEGEPDRVVVVANVRWGISGKSRFRMLPKYATGS